MTTKLSGPRQRQGRIHFHKHPNPYPLEMVQMGMEALNYLTIFPALTSWQVCRLLFLNRPNRHGEVRSEEAARRATNRECLRRLKDLGLVGVKPIARLDNPLTKWEMNYLTRQGHQALTQHRESLGLATLPFRNPANLTYQTINPHAVALLDVAVSAFAAAGRGGVSVEVWLDDVSIRSLSKRGQLDWPMEPDALLVLRYGDNRQALFIEVDMGTESVDSPRQNSWSSKMSRYKTYFATLRRDDPWLKDLPQPQLLTITTGGAKRLANLKDATARGGGRSAYWFAETRHLDPPFSFSGEVWQRIGLDGYHSVFSLFAS